MKRFLSVLFLLCVTVFIAGCRLAIIVVEGGEVQSTGSGTCISKGICIVDIDDPSFSDTFVAVPREDWYFHQWQEGDRFFCGSSTDPRCVLSLVGLEDSDAIQALVASSELFYLMPVFKPYGNAVVVNDKQWFQPDLFFLTWDEINSVCPGGPCTAGGRLSGYDMTGWTWASIDELNALFNYYLGAGLLGPGPAEYDWGVMGDEQGDNHPANLDFANDFYSDGWRATEEGSIEDEDPDNNPNYTRRIAGWVADNTGQRPYGWTFFKYAEYPWGFETQISTRLIVGSPEFQGYGAWFYRTPETE